MKIVYSVIVNVCIDRIINIGNVNDVSFYNFRFIKVIVRNRDKLILFSIEIV